MFRRKPLNKTLFFPSLAAVALSAYAQTGVIVDFDGGDVANSGGTTTIGITGNTNTYSAQFYVEGGVEMTLSPSTADLIVGDYYSVGEGVIHGHWTETGGNMDIIRFELASGEPFDLNYYVLTSNTQIGGGAATGNEDTYIIASVDGVTESFRQQLPPEDWGISDGVREIYLGPEFDGIRAFWFDSDGSAFCFGMDKFYVNLAPPAPSTPDPIVVGSGTVDDAITGSSGNNEPTSVPVNPLWMLLMLSGLGGILGSVYSRKRS